VGGGGKPKRNWRVVLASAFWILFVLGASVYMLSATRELRQRIPYPQSAVPPLGGAILVELFPRSWRADFWTDVGLRAMVIGSICWSVYQLTLGRP